MDKISTTKQSIWNRLKDRVMNYGTGHAEESKEQRDSGAPSLPSTVAPSLGKLTVRELLAR